MSIALTAFNLIFPTSALRMDLATVRSTCNEPENRLRYALTDVYACK